MGLQEDLKYRFARINIAEKLIVINIITFVVPLFIISVSGLFNVDTSQLLGWIKLWPNFDRLLFRPWTLITYGFLHDGFFHIFWNMYILFFAGRIFLNLFNGRRFLNVYFLGIICGGLAFMLSYNIFPLFANKYGPIVGASAGVMAVLIFVATYLPNKDVRLIFFNVKLWHIGLFFVVKDLLSLSLENGGGSFAHLGGALLGFMYARQLAKGNDIGEWFAKLMDGFANLFRPGKKRSKLKTVHKKSVKTSPAKPKRTITKSAQQQRVDAILDKISKSGYESLTKEEKDFLFKAGKE